MEDDLIFFEKEDNLNIPKNGRIPQQEIYKYIDTIHISNPNQT